MMPLLVIAPIVIASVSGYVGIMHIMLFLRMRQRKEDLNFALSCFAVALYAVFTAGLYASDSVSLGARWQRGQLASISLLGMVFLLFIREYLSVKESKSLVIMSAIYFLLLLICIFDRWDLVLTGDSAVKVVSLPFGGTVTYYEKAVGPVTMLSTILDIIAFGVVFWKAFQALKTGRKGRARSILVPLLLFFVTVLNDSAVAGGLYRSVYLIEFGYVAIVLSVTYTLTGEVIRSGLYERALKTSQKRSAAIFQNVDNGIGFLDLGGRVIQANQRLLDMLGHEKGELIGMQYSEVSHEEDVKIFRDGVRSILSGKARSFNMEGRLRRKGGKIIWGNQSVTAFRGHGDKVESLIMVVVDVTGRKRSEEEVRMEKNRAEFYLDLLSHDLGNLHQGMNAWITIAHDDPERRVKAIGAAKSLMDRSMKLTKDVLFLSRVKERRFEPRPMDIIPVLRSCIKDVRTTFSEKEVRIVEDLPEGALVIMTEPLIRELFFNLLHNAVKFQEGPTAKVEVAAIKRKDSVEISISDHGPGIPDDLKTIIFDRYTKAASRKHSGIGLSLVKELTDRHHGIITVGDRIEGDPGSGARFTVELPFKG